MSKIIIVFIIILVISNIILLYFNYRLNNKVKLVENKKNIPSRNKDEEKMFKGIIDIRKTTASEILTPRTALFMLDGDTTLEENWDEILEQGFSRIPIYIENSDNIIGILVLKDALKYVNKNQKEVILKNIVRKPYFIPGTKKVVDILSLFQKTQNHIAVIIDEYGGTEGILTIEDILEEIVGEIRDENDIEDEKIIKVFDNVYDVNGDISIDDINEELNINIPLSEEYDTLSGYFMHTIGKIPTKKDSIKTDKYILKVLKLDNVRIEKMKLILLEEK